MHPIDELSEFLDGLKEIRQEFDVEQTSLEREKRRRIIETERAREQKEVDAMKQRAVSKIDV